MEGQRKGKGGGGGGRGSGGGKQSSAQDFIGFHYERPSVNAPPSSTPKRAKRTPAVVATKEESVHASFRFIVSALANPLEPALYDPDCVLPWAMVECVVVPLNQEHTLLCPICLDTVHAPRITKCGHTFCVTCLLRHMQSDRSNAQKCPMCMEYICRSDLRSVMFMYDHWDAEDTAMAAAQATGGGTGGGGGCEDTGLLHPFYVFQPYRGQLTVNCLAAKGVDVVTGGGTAAAAAAAAATTTTTTTATATATAAASSSALQVQQPHAFHHLIVEKGNCRPHLPQKLLRFVLDHPHAAAATTTVVGRGGPSSSRRSTSSSSSTVSNSVGGSLAEQLTSLQRVLPNEVGDEEARYARLMYRPWAVSCARWQQEEHLLRTWQTELYREHDLDSVACLVQALEMVQQIRDERSKFLQSHFLVDVPDFFSPPSTRPAPVYEGSSSSAIAPVTTASLPSLLDNDALYQHLYQSIHGDAVYLHPLCQRALQAEYEQQRGGGGSGGSGGSGGWPPVVTGRVVDVEYVRLGASARDKPAYLRHLPAYSAVSIVELDMKKLVSREIYEQFASEFARRQQKRREKKKQEQRHERHVAQKYRQREAQQQQRLYQQYSGDDLYFDDFAYSQHFPTATATAQAAAVSDDADIAAIEAAFAALAASSEGNIGLLPPPPLPSASSPPVARFAEITQMHGHFPSLGGGSGASVVREGSAESTAASTGGSSVTGTGAGAGAGGAPKVPTAARGRSAGVGTAATAATAPVTSTGGRPAASLAPASSLSLVANRKPTSSAASSSSSLVAAAGSKSLIRSAVLASSSSSTTTSAATGGVTFTLEDALKNSRGKVQKKGAKKTSTPATVTVTATVTATDAAGSSAETTSAPSPRPV